MFEYSNILNILIYELIFSFFLGFCLNLQGKDIYGKIFFIEILLTSILTLINPEIIYFSELLLKYSDAYLEIQMPLNVDGPLSFDIPGETKTDLQNISWEINVNSEDLPSDSFSNLKDLNIPDNPESDFIPFSDNKNFDIPMIDENLKNSSTVLDELLIAISKDPNFWFNIGFFVALGSAGAFATHFFLFQ